MTNTPATKVIKLKLLSGNRKFFYRAFEQSILEGWKLSTLQPTGTDLQVAYFERSVPVESTEPDLRAWNCRLNTEGTTTVPLEAPVEAVTAKAEESNTLGTPQEETPLSPAVEAPTKVYDKTAKGFEKRPYTETELEDWTWANICKLAGEMGVIEGTRPERIALIVEQSQMWGD